MSPRENIDEAALLAAALSGSAEHRRALVRYLNPVIHVRAAAHVARRRRSGMGGSRSDVDDLVQEVWAVLLRDGQAALRRWEPSRGASLTTFVGLCASRAIVSYDRGGARRGAREICVEASRLDHIEGARRHDDRVADIDLVSKVLNKLRSRLSERGEHALDAMFVEGLSVAEAEPRTGMTKSALYTWRREIKLEARKVLDELVPEPEGSR